MSEPVRHAALFIHPVVGLAVVALAVHSAAALRARHRRLGPWVLGLVAINWVAGLVTVWFDPRNPDLATSMHFRVGTGLVVLYGTAALISRWIDDDPRARAVHPWIGAVALLLSGVQVFLGLQLMPL